MIKEVNFEKIYTLEEVVKARTDMILQEEIVKQFYPLVKSQAAKFDSADVVLLDYDDKIQIGLLGVIDAIETYNGTTKFTTHVNNRVRFALMNEKRRQCNTKNFGVCLDPQNGVYAPAKNVISIYTEVYSEQTNNKNYSETIVDIYKDDSETPYETLLKKNGWECIKSLCNEKQLKYFYLSHIKDKKQKDVADEMGTSQANVRSCLNTIYNKVRKNYSVEELSEMLCVEL